MRVEGKTAFVTGAARGLGRSHAVRLAEEGADVIGVDVGQALPTVTAYAGVAADDLDETASEVEARGRRMFAARADVRRPDQLTAALEQGLAELGRGGLDIVVANAGIVSFERLEDLSDEVWRETIDINLTGVWNTVKAALPHIRDRGSIVIIASTAARKGFPRLAHYVTAKTGLVGLTRTLATELGPRGIRANAVLPTSVHTPLNQNEDTYRLFLPDVEHPTREQFVEASRAIHSLPVPWVEPVDVSNAVLFLASDEARYITGSEIPVDAGLLSR